jgi:hypothetical protein
MSWRFAARVPGLAFGLALAVSPLGSPGQRRAAGAFRASGWRASPGHTLSLRTFSLPSGGMSVVGGHSRSSTRRLRSAQATGGRCGCCTLLLQGADVPGSGLSVWELVRRVLLVATVRSARRLFIKLVKHLKSSSPQVANFIGHAVGVSGLTY